MEKTKETLAAVLDCLFEAEEILAKGFFAGGDERSALLEAHSLINRAKRLAYEEVTIGDIDAHRSEE